MVRAMTRGRHRGHPRRGLQPHGRGQRVGSDPVFPRDRQRVVLPAGGRGARALLRHDGHRQQPADASPTRPAADQGLPALLGHRDARRRLSALDLAGDTGSAVPRGRPAVGVLLRPGAAGPRRQPGQADRRALGRRWTVATRVGNFPPRCGPSGTASTATPSATSGAASRRPWGEFASRLTGSSDLYEHSGRRPFASINFVTAPDGFTMRDLVSYNEKHNEANGRGQQRRRELQPILELRRRGRKPRTRTS